MSARDARTFREQSSQLGALLSLAVNDTGNERAGRQRSCQQVVFLTNDSSGNGRGRWLRCESPRIPFFFSRLTDRARRTSLRKRGLPWLRIWIRYSSIERRNLCTRDNSSVKVGRSVGTPVGSECSGGPTNQLIAKPSYRFKCTLWGLPCARLSRRDVDTEKGDR